MASGDESGGKFGTFNPLYFKSPYFNDASVIRPSNIIDVHPTLQLLPKDNLLITIGSDVIWRYTTEDAIYNPGGQIVIPPGGSSPYVATTADLSGSVVDRVPPDPSSTTLQATRSKAWVAMTSISWYRFIYL